MTAVEPREVLSLFNARLKDLKTSLQRGPSSHDIALAKTHSIRAFGREAETIFTRSVAIPQESVGSWIRGVPIPSMLGAKRRLTVDVTPETLGDFGSSYGLSPSALIDFAESGVLLINIRDYDPESPNPDQTIRAYAAADITSFLPRLFERASKHVYFVSTLRDDIFNPMFRSGGSLRHSFDEAAKLETGAKAAADLSPYSDLIRKAVFRNERPSLNAVRWHWAYTQAMQRFLRQIDPEMLNGIDEEFNRAGSETDPDQAAADYLDLATRLRYCHLLESAPISASFGGVYNLLLDGEAEFLQAVRFGGRLADYDLTEDRLLDTIRSLQIGRLPPDVSDKVPQRFRQILSAAGVQVFLRAGVDSYLKFYEDEDNRRRLEAYVLEDDQLEGRAVRLEEDVDALLSRPSPTANEVASLVAENQSIALARGVRLSKFTNGHSEIAMAKADLLSVSSTPIYEANPKFANLLLEAVKAEGRRPSIGSARDFERRTFWYPKVFRRPPH